MTVRPEDFGAVPVGGAEVRPEDFGAVPAGKPPEYGDLNPMAGAAEGGMAVLTSALAAPVAGLSGIAAAFAKTLGITDTEAADVVRKVQEHLTIQPKSETGQKVAGAIAYPFEKLAQGADFVGGKVAEVTDSPALGAAVNTAIQVAAPVAAVKGVGAAAPKVRAGLAKLAPDEPQMAGVGSAETDLARVRMERAEALPVPLKLTKGQATRDFEQQRFEREKAKDGKSGALIRDRFAEQNEKILQNFDAWVDEVGASAPDLRAVGKGVDAALVAKAAKAKGEINAAYERARAAGEADALVPTDDLVAYLDANQPAAINAPVLSSVEQKLVQLKGATKGEDGKLQPGNLSLNDLEELRKFVGKVSRSDETNAHFGGEVKSQIDAMTDGRGGDLYRQARRLRTRYGQEFEDRGVINRILSTKPGSSDRAVAYEDVFSHSILNGSLDDVRHVRRVLQTGGAEGNAAWSELQGATVNYIKEQATKNVARDVRGNEIVSASALDKAIVNLDKDGKLDFIFGKKGATQLRDINDLAKDVYTSPPGAVNTSGTASVLMEALSEMAMGKISMGTTKALATAKQLITSRKTKRRIHEALEYDPAAVQRRNRASELIDTLGGSDGR